MATEAKTKRVGTSIPTRLEQTHVNDFNHAPGETKHIHHTSNITQSDRRIQTQPAWETLNEIKKKILISINHFSSTL
jgi:hypothetical protein